ncbi:Exosome complex component RRP43 [Armadillidium nasatum]|uniref:Ribosomal RNA-processing protein 43 n=1 Tax=Armadillidium nasatum TaxID=96803 RepID=A0A5N5SU84_9CRUS|nr:Exosome complex component RRP43 [Armadillidium nasatum]
MTALNAWKVIEPDSFYRSFIEKQQRPDERKWLEARPVTLKVSSITTADGSATVRLGNTTVVCGVKAEISVPDLREPNKGFIIPNIELHPCCSPTVKTGPPGEKAMVTSQFLAKVIESCNVIDKKTLCIVPNKLSWCLYCDVICLDYDGNLGDASLLALVAALQDTTLPKVEFDEETEKIVVENEKTEKLKVLSRPISTTITLYSSDIHLLDPTAEDESEGNGEITLVLKDSNTLGLTHKSGGQMVTPDNLQKFMDLAKKRVKELTKIMNKAFKT